MGNQFASLAKSYWPFQGSDNALPQETESVTSNVDIRPVADSGNDVRAAENQNGSAALVPEALPNMRILINHELPSGAGNEHNITVDPRVSVSQLRSIMEYYTKIPQDNIYFIYKTTPLKDNQTLSEQGVEPYDTLAMRDNRLSYEHPY